MPFDSEDEAVRLANDSSCAPGRGSNSLLRARTPDPRLQSRATAAAHALPCVRRPTDGLTSYVQSADPARVRRVARRLRAGMVVANGAARAAGAPFGGVKQSGNGREGGEMGLREFLEVKSISGWPGE